MSEAQAAPAVEKVDEKEAQACLRAFEVGIGKRCAAGSIGYDEFAKLANAKYKFAEKAEEAPGRLAPWLVDEIVAQATKEEQAKA